MKTRSAPVLAVQRLVVRAGRPLLALWRALYGATARTVAWYLTRGEDDVAVYLRGGGGRDDFLPGLSDLDMVLVPAGDPGAPGTAAARIRRRWERLRSAFPPVALVVDGPRAHEEAELRELAGQSTLTLGSGGSAYFGDGATLDRLRMLERPGLYGATAGWQRLRGPDRRPPEPRRDRQDTRLAAWLELAYWWRLAFLTCAAPVEPRATDMCVKFVAEPARIWLWLVHGERAAGRLEALRRALVLMPEEERALRWALEVHASLPARRPAPLAEALAAMLRISARIAEAIAIDVAEVERTEVRLAGVPEDGPPPLADWRALACPPEPGESFELLPGSPADPKLVGRLAQAPGANGTLVSGDLMVRPATPLRRSRMRAIHCPPTDPASFALARGADTAAFPRLRGWSAEDYARRAVAEHAAWVGRGEPARPAGMLLVAARAALFSESLDEGRPELVLTLNETRRRLDDRWPGGVPEDTAALQRLVADLPAFSATGVRPQRAS